MKGLPGRSTRLVIGLGLIPADDVLRYGVRARDVSQSNGVALVEAGNGRGFAVKDMRPRPDTKQGTAERERRLYEAVSDHDDLLPFLPGYFRQDEDRELMILEGLITSRRLDHVSGGQGVLDPELAGALGEAIGQWHEGSKPLEILGEAHPWLLHINEPERLRVLESDEALHAVTVRIVEDPELRGQIERVLSLWTADAFIHGDMRFANIMVCMSPRALRFVDWETSGWGDGRWDVAGVVQEFLSIGLNQGYSLADSSGADQVRSVLLAYRKTRQRALDWSEMAPFVSARLLMRAIQLANWPDATEKVIEQHLELARELGTVDDDPFESDPAAIIPE